MAVVDQAEVHDVDGDFRVVAGLERFPDLLFQLLQRHRGAGLGRGRLGRFDLEAQGVGVLFGEAEHVAIDDHGVAAAERLRDVGGLALLEGDLGADGNDGGLDVAG